MTSGDGIYSRYVTTYPAPGRYSIRVTVDDNNGRAYTIQIGRGGRSMPTKPPQASFPVCCGSKIQVPLDLRLSTGSFKRTAATSPVIHLLRVPIATNTDRMPPARIGDLRLTTKPQQSELLAEWTAPGGNYDTGFVSGYKFIYSDSIVDILSYFYTDPNKASGLKILEEVQRPDEAGIAAQHTFSFKKYDKDYHVAMFAFDESGNGGRISNVILIRMPSGDGQNPGPGPGPNNPDKTNWLTIGIIAASIVGSLLFLLIALYIYFICVRRKQLQQRQNQLKKSKSSGVNVDLQHGVTTGTTGSDHTDASSYDDIKNSSSNQLVPTISTISDVYHQHTAIPNGGRSFGNGITPTYWSASQLLKEHEERKRREAEEEAAEANMKLSSGANFPEETNMAYDYGGEQFQPYGYYGSGMVHGTAEGMDPYPVQYDLYYGQQPPQMGYPYDGPPSHSMDHMTGYPINYPPPVMSPENEYNLTSQQAIPPGSNGLNLIEEGISSEGGNDQTTLLMGGGNGVANGNTIVGDRTNVAHSASSNSSNQGNQVHNASTVGDGPTAAMPKHSNASDNSSSGTLGIINPSLQGSLLSVDGRPPSIISKTRNITQV